MITLHESNITSFPLDNGIGVLSDVIVAYTEEELNGMFEFYMEYDSEGHLVEELKEERIIKAKAQDKLGYQLFRIYSITKNHENDNLIVNAQHITYDLANNFVEKMEANRLTKKQVMEKIGASTVIPHTFNITSSNTTTVSSTSLYRTNPLQMIAGMEGSVLQIWGGQIERDNFNLILHDRRGHDDGVTVTYEKNITGLEATFDISSVITRIFPFVYIEATDDEPERLITVDGKYIDSPHINDYEVIRTEPVDYSSDDRIDTQDKTDTHIRQQLTKVAKDYFKETGNDKIKVEMDVQFAHLWETEEYKDVKVLELVGMGDTVTINHSKLNVDATAIVNYIKYDCIAQVNEEVKLGSVKARLTDSINKIDSIEKKVEQAESHANQAIVSANGKNTTFYGPDEPVEGMKKGDLWFKVIDGQYHKTYRYDGIEWQLIIDMDSQEAKQEAQQAKDRAEEAVERANQATQQANESIKQAQSAFDKALESLDETAEIRTELGELSYTVTDNSTRINTLTITTDRLSGRLEKLDIRGYNFITHLPKLWEHGFYGITGVDDMEAGAKYDSDQLIRLSDKYRLEPNTDYVLSDHPELAREGYEYIETNLFLHLWNEDGSYSRYLVLNFKNEEHFITFKTRETETHFSLHVMPTNPDVYLKPDDVHNVFFYKLALGTEKSGWTPNLDDTSELVSDVQNFVHDFSITAESLASRITDNAGRITTISSTVDGLQTTVSSIDGHVSNLTQLSTLLETRLTDAEGNISSMAQTVLSLQSTVTDVIEGTQSMFTQLSDAINLRVEKGDVINQINISDESILIDGKRIHITGQTTIDNGVIKSANIQSLDAGKITSGTLDAGKISVINLSANSIVGGILSSQNSNTTFNLNTGELTIQNTDFTLGGSAKIRFIDSRNAILFWRNNLYSGVGFDIGTSGNPITFIGTSMNSLRTNDDSWSGLIVSSQSSQITEDTFSSFTSRRFLIRDKLNYDKGIMFDLDASRPAIRPVYGATHSYDLGSTNNWFRRVYADGVRVTQGYFAIRNKFAETQGLRVDTGYYDGSMTVRKIHASDTMNLGSSTHRFTNIYLTYQPIVSSDRRLKENIKDNTLGLDFINDIETYTFNFTPLKMRKNEPLQYGIIAQQLKSVLEKHGVNIDNLSMLSVGDDGYYGVQYEQFIAPLIKSVQELDTKLTDNVEFLKLKVQYLEQKIKILEEKVS